MLAVREEGSPLDRGGVRLCPVENNLAADVPDCQLAT